MTYSEADFTGSPEDAFTMIETMLEEGAGWQIQRKSPGRIIQASGNRDYNPYNISGLAGGLIGVPLIWVALHVLFDVPHSTYLNLLTWTLIWSAFVSVILVAYYASTQRNSIFFELLDYSGGTGKMAITSVGHYGEKVADQAKEKLMLEREYSIIPRNTAKSAMGR